MRRDRYIVESALVVIAALALSVAYAQMPAGSMASDQPTGSGMAPTSQPAAKVRIDSFAFQPKQLEIPANTTVTWENVDDVPHTASSKGDPQTFDSGALDTDATWSFTFKKPGTYPYYCKVHPHMTGTIVVK